MKFQLRHFAFLTVLGAITFMPAAVHAEAGGNPGVTPAPSAASTGPGELSPSDHWQSRTWQREGGLTPSRIRACFTAPE